MGYYDIDYDAEVRQLLPDDLRNDFMIAWLIVQITPVKFVAALFSANRAANLYRLSFNSQVCYLEAVLNNEFDVELRRIQIANGDRVYPLYIYRSTELKPRYLHKSADGAEPWYLYKQAETVAYAPSFKVLVPAALSFDINQMKALINRYKLATKTYLIILV